MGLAPHKVAIATNGERSKGAPRNFAHAFEGQTPIQRLHRLREEELDLTYKLQQRKRRSQRLEACLNECLVECLD
eukprot:6658937-Prorocentrum_lima.AAC.1